MVQRGVDFTPANSEGLVLAGNISHSPAQMVLFVLAGGLCCLSAQMHTITWKIRIFQAISNGETLNMKVVDPEKLWNFIVYTFLIWIRLVPQKPIYTRCSIIWVEPKLYMDAYECVVSW
jgi:hypothetical protein